MAFTANTVVRASAGTGKTRKLVEVYLELLSEGVAPVQIAAVTFTEKAAGEMRDRIRTAIFERAGAATPEHRRLWMGILAALPAAPISTIHGFCGILLREHGTVLGVDPSFAILDEQRSLDLARDSAVDAIRTAIRSGDESAARIFGDFGLERLVEAIVSTGYRLNSTGKDTSWLLDRIEEQRQAAAALRPDLVTHFEEYGDDFEQIGVIADELDAKKAKHPFKKRDEVDAALPRIGQIAGVEAARDLVRLIADASKRFAARKRSINALDFDDLLLFVRDMLERFPDVRRFYQERFRAILVDEFQDTDEVQAAIVALLAQDPSGERRFAPRKLLIAGDPKQSIYRFRRARVTVFFRMLDQIVNDGGVLEHLQENRRSAAPIAAFANRLSEFMMDGKGKVSIDPSGAVDPDLSYRIRFEDTDALTPKSESPFLGITYVAADAHARAITGREMEAEAIARLLKKWKASGTIRSWKEAAMLFRASTNMGLYLHALERHGIPTYVIEGVSFYRKTEVSDLIAMLELTLRPNDPILKAIVLSSSLAGVAFQDLISGASSATFDEILRPWIEMRDRATAAEILEDIVRRTNFDVVMMAQHNGPQRVANIGKLIETTRDLSREGAAGLDDVVRHLRDRANDPEVREPEAQILGQDDEVVRMLTVHQAKGLEFEIVIVPDLAANAGRNSAERTFFSDRWGLLCGAGYGLHRKPLPHSLILEAREQEADQQYEEEKRLLYVAVTRAKKMLVLGEGFTKRGGPWLEWTHRLFESVQAGAIDRARAGKPVKVKFKGGKEAPDFSVDIVPASLLNIPEQLTLAVDTAMVGERAVWAQLRDLRDAIERRAPLRADRLELTPSQLMELDGCFRRFYWTRILGRVEPSESAPNSDAVRLGSAVHSILESGVRPSNGELARQGLTDLITFFESREWRALLADQPQREVPFLLRLDADGRECWIRGRMDALTWEKKPRIIDYKYAVWTEERAAGYEVQLLTYCLAAMKSLDVEWVASELWFLKPPLKIVRCEYSRAAAEARINALVMRYATALETDEWPPARRSYCDEVACGFRTECFSAQTQIVKSEVL